MPLLLQARITSVSFEEARYRHYRAQQRREGALRKAAAEVRQRAPSPLDEDGSPLEMWEEEAGHEGCNLFGYVEVSRAPGTIHLAPHSSRHSFDFSHVNTSHHIHHLSFGVPYPNRVNPLDGSKAILHDGSGVFQYFIKVVPTTYEFASGLALDSCQYSVTDQFKSAHNPQNGFVLPGVFFIYDISPIMVKFTEKRMSFTYFLTSLCAIVGGVFTVAGIIDGAIYQLWPAGRGKQLGQ